MLFFIVGARVIRGGWLLISAECGAGDDYVAGAHTKLRFLLWGHGSRKIGSDGTRPIKILMYHFVESLMETFQKLKLENNIKQTSKMVCLHALPI